MTGMWAFFERLLDSSTLSPHGICLLWEPELIWLHVISDAVIAASYFSIPVALSIFVSKRRDVDFGWIFWAFALFITACGFTHVLSIITLWVPVYGIEGLIKAAVAIAASRNRARAGAGGPAAARGRRHAAPFAEDGCDRPTDRRRRA
jgi:hypothetical protein